MTHYYCLMYIHVHLGTHVEAYVFENDSGPKKGHHLEPIPVIMITQLKLQSHK